MDDKYLTFMEIKENYRKILEKIEASGRKINVLAVTKKRTLEQVKEVIEAGAKLIGESQLQEAYEKITGFNVKKHFIGHVQTNKVKGILELFDVIESVDSLKVAKEIDKKAKGMGKVVEVYIQVNIGEEENKFGIDYKDAEEFYSKLLLLTNIKVTGLMCIPPFGEDSRPYFRKMKILFDKLPLKNLSMGMSDDFEIAIEEGATEVRIGKLLFN